MKKDILFKALTSGLYSEKWKSSNARFFFNGDFSV